MIVHLCPDLPSHLEDLWFYHPDNETLKQLLDEAIEQLGVNINTVGGIRLIESSFCPRDTIYIGSSHSNVFKVMGVGTSTERDLKQMYLPNSGGFTA